MSEPPVGQNDPFCTDNFMGIFFFHVAICTLSGHTTSHQNINPDVCTLQGQIKYSKATEPPTALLDLTWYTGLLTQMAKKKSDTAESYTTCMDKETPVSRENKLLKTIEGRISIEKVKKNRAFICCDNFFR